MSRAWKSSDGGSIRVLGASILDADYSANATLISAAVNVRGVTLRTASMLNVGGGGYGYIAAGGAMIFCCNTGTGGDMSNEIFIPAGQAVTLVRIAGTIHVGLTYTIH